MANIDEDTAIVQETSTWGQLRELLTLNELACLVEALDAVINKQKAYGTIEIDVRQKRVYVFGIKSTIRPE